ncbi:MAG: hypothetical protein M3381_10435 [Actinomycetota bacterium]|nr:hypothetical protein [Actinomycetota bacterium]
MSGNIGQQAIEIEQNANLYPGGPTVKCPLEASTAIDWVKDCEPNTDPPTVEDSIATGVVPGMSGAVRTGHWNGARIVDGVGNADGNIFLTGGKEQKPHEWNVGPGSVGSAKYDITQAYLANNGDDVFFGMERRGNNGTTAFDFEFNQLPPTINPLGSEVPDRSAGDVLLTFEMQGSGNTGSAVPHYYTYDGNTSTYVESPSLPAGIQSFINQTAIPAAPWGYVNSRGNWVTGSLDRFEFAEARVNLDLLDPSGTFNPCAGAERFVQVRTRSSAVDTSDLKDATEIFKYTFFEPVDPTTTLSVDCEQSFTYATSGSSAAWKFTVPNSSGATLSGGGVTQSVLDNQVWTSTATTGTVNVTLPAGEDSVQIAVEQTALDANGCTGSGSGSITVYRELSVDATLGALCDNQFTYSSTVSGGKAPYSYEWSFKRNTGTPDIPAWTEVGKSTLAAGTFDADDVMGGGAGDYKADLLVKDTSDAAISGKPQCQAATSVTTTVFDAVGGSLQVTPDCDNTFAFSTTATGGNGSYTYAWTLQKQKADGTYQDAKTGTSSSGALDINDASLVNGGEGVYRMVMTITDTQGLTPPCSITLTSDPFTVRNALTVTASKAAEDSRTSVALTAAPSSTAGVSYQWAKKNAQGAFVDVTGATGVTYTGYSTFEADDVTPDPVTHMIGSDTYMSKVYVVDFRVTASRTLNGVLCTEIALVTVKKVIGVDP